MQLTIGLLAGIKHARNATICPLPGIEPAAVQFRSNALINSIQDLVTYMHATTPPVYFLKH